MKAVRLWVQICHRKELSRLIERKEGRRRKRKKYWISSIKMG